MTYAIQSTGYLSFLDIFGIGFSEDSNKLSEYIIKEIDEFKNAETIGRPINDLILTLREIYDECSVNGWDGYDAEPVSNLTYLEALNLVQKLTLVDLPFPEIVVEPTGDIALEWYKSENYVFVVSVHGKNEIIYAGLFGSNSINGKEYYGNTLPEIVVSCLKRLFFT